MTEIEELEKRVAKTERGLDALAKVMGALIGQQERTEKLLELIVRKESVEATTRITN